MLRPLPLPLLSYLDAVAIGIASQTCFCPDYVMASACYTLLPLLCHALCSVQSLSLDALVAQSGIYLQREQGEVAVPQVEQLATPDSVKLIVHGFLGSRSHSSIMPLRNGKQHRGSTSNCTQSVSLLLLQPTRRRAMPTCS